MKRRFKTIAIHIIATAVCIPFQFQATADCTNPPTGLVGFWPGDGGANDVAGTNNGTLGNGAIIISGGQVGSMFSFNGTNGYVSIPDATALKPTNLTIEAWVKFDSLTSATSNAPAGEQYIVMKKNSRTGGNFEGFALEKKPNNALQFLVCSSAGTVANAESSPVVSTGVWYHVAGVRGSNFIRLYTNGVLAAQITNISFNQDYGTTPLFFGTSGMASYDARLKGKLDEVSLYSRALSSNEVFGIYLAGTNGKCRPCSSYFPDLFSCRAQLSGTNASTTVSIYGATGESGEPSHAIANFSLTNSVWLTWLAPFSGAATIRATCPTNGTTIHVYSGNAVTNLTEISGGLAEFTNSFGLYENLVTFSAGSNVTYQIAVDCNGGALPSHVVTLYLNLTNPPPNDHFTNATVIPGMFFQASGSFDGATMETGETNHEAYIYGPFGVQWPATDTLWWKWAAPTNLGVGIIPVNIMADAVSFPPMIRVYQGNSLSNLTSVFSTDSESGMTHSTEFLATAGETYYLAMAGLQNDPRYLNVSSRYGDFRLRLNARALVLNISSVNTFGFGPTVPFQAIVNVSNHGSATSDLLRLVVVARSGVGVRGVDYGYTVSDEQILFITNLSALIPDQNIDVAVDGVVPGPVGDVNCIPPDYCNYNGTNGIGYGVYAELQEQVGSNWFPVDQALVTFGRWPELGATPSGPGAGVIRLDPSAVGLSNYWQFQGVQIWGTNQIPEGKTGSYLGSAWYYQSKPVSNYFYVFTNSTWQASKFQITNGVFKTGSVTSNTSVSMSIKYTKSGYDYTGSTNILVLNLPAPSLSLQKVQTNVVVSFQGVSNRSNRLEVASSLTPPVTWTAVSNFVLGSNGVLNVSLPIGTNKQRFFRGREME